MREEVYLSPYGRDIREIKDFLEYKGLYIQSPETIFKLYSHFSEDCYCAGWLIYDLDILEQFWEYVCRKIQDGEINLTILS